MDGYEAMQKAYQSILAHDFDQAIAWFKQAVKACPDNAEYHYRLSISCMRSSRLTEASNHARRAAELEPDDETYRSHYERVRAREHVAQAQNYLEEGRDRAYFSILLLKQAVELDPLSTDAYLLLGMSYADVDDYRSALRAISEVLRLEPDHSLAIRLKQEYEQQLHQYTTSSTKFEKSEGK